QSNAYASRDPPGMTANRAPASGRDGSARRRAAGGSCVGVVHALQHRIDGPCNITDLGASIDPIRPSRARTSCETERSATPEREVRATTLRNAVTAKQTAAAAW